MTGAARQTPVWSRPGPDLRGGVCCCELPPHRRHAWPAKSSSARGQCSVCIRALSRVGVKSDKIEFVPASDLY